MGERKGGPGDGKPDPNKIYGPKGGVLIQEVVIRGVKKQNGIHAFMQMSFDFDKGFDDGVMEYTKDAYSFATKNAYSKNYWQEKGGEELMGAAFISDVNKIRPDGSTSGMDLFNSVSKASAYDVGHFAGYNGAQFATRAALTEGGGFLLNSIRSIRLNPTVGMRTLSRQEMTGVWGKGNDYLYQDYDQARNAAFKWLDGQGFKAEKQVVGKFGTSEGKAIGMKNADANIGFRVEYDARSGAHINVFSGQLKGPHFQFNASEKTVNKIITRFSK